MKKLILLFSILQSLIFAQSFRLMTYNLLNYPGSDTTGRNPYFRTILSEANPDILAVQEITSKAGADGFLNNVLNSFGFYSTGVFIDGPDTDNAIYFRDSLFSFISNTPVKTALRDISQFKLLNKISGDTLIIFSAHFKASQGSSNILLRAAEVDSLRKVTNQLATDADYFIVGDFNLYTSNESGYQKLLRQDQTGYFFDPIDKPGNWNNNSLFASIHTQSPRTRQFGGGSNGGLDDRFDFILISQAVKDVNGITYLEGSYKALGNDGNHFNDSINKQPNTAVSVSVANALHYASDHLPVYADFSYDDVIPVELTSFSGYYQENRVLLNWNTASENNVQGFEVQKSPNGFTWINIGFIPSANNSTENISYSFLDSEIIHQSFYRLKIIDLDGSLTYSKTININLPDAFKLYQNYPNPFNAETTFSFSIIEKSYINLTLFDVKGEKIQLIFSGNKESGFHQINFNSETLPSGVYFVELTAGNISERVKLSILK